MGYIVTAPLVLAKNHEGGDLYVYGPAAVPQGQSADWIERHLRDGMIAAAPEPSSAPLEPAVDPGSGAQLTAEDLAGMDLDAVRGYLEAHPDQGDHVRALETGGRQRKGVLALVQA